MAQSQRGVLVAVLTTTTIPAGAGSSLHDRVAVAFEASNLPMRSPAFPSFL